MRAWGIEGESKSSKTIRGALCVRKEWCRPIILFRLVANSDKGWTEVWRVDISDILQAELDVARNLLDRKDPILKKIKEDIRFVFKKKRLFLDDIEWLMRLVTSASATRYSSQETGPEWGKWYREDLKILDESFLGRVKELRND